MALLSIVLCLVSGYLMVALGWSRQAPQTSDLGLRLSLSVGYGLGNFSVVFFLSRVFGVTHLIAGDLVVIALLLAGFFLLRTHVISPGNFVSAKTDPDGLASFHQVPAVAFIIAQSAAVYSAVLRANAHPHGEGWDAFAVWNLHARFLFRGGAHWRAGFSALIPWSHPDYPLLLPAAVAHFWTYLGHDAPAVPAMIGLGFTFGTVGILFSSLALLRGRTSALLGGLTLLATPFFIEQGTSQYADVPLSLFFLATIVLLCLYDCRRDDLGSRPGGLLFLAGMAAAFAAWTKNEGLLFVCAIVTARLLVLLRVRSRRAAKNEVQTDAGKSAAETWTALALLLVSIAPVLFLIGWFKHSVAPPGDLLSDQATTLHKVLDPVRYWAILKWYAKEFFRFGHWLLLPGTLLLAGLYLAAGKVGRRQGPGLQTAVITLALTVAGYFAVYLITPYDIYWHLRFSLGRLFLQLWPSAIFVFFLIVRFEGPVASRVETGS